MTADRQELLRKLIYITDKHGITNFIIDYSHDMPVATANKRLADLVEQARPLVTEIIETIDKLFIELHPSEMEG